MSARKRELRAESESRARDNYISANFYLTIEGGSRCAKTMMMTGIGRSKGKGGSRAGYTAGGLQGKLGWF